MSNWKDITTAPENQWILIRYKKYQNSHFFNLYNRSNILCITEATYSTLHNGWYDYAGRLICTKSTQENKHIITEWMELPE